MEWLKDSVISPIMAVRTDRFFVVTHDDVETDEAIFTYRLKKNPTNPEALDQLIRSKHFYWTSPSQFEVFEEHLPQNAEHACGLGKTASFLADKSVQTLRVFPSSTHWQNWLKGRSRKV